MPNEGKKKWYGAFVGSLRNIFKGKTDEPLIEATDHVRLSRKTSKSLTDIEDSANAPDHGTPKHDLRFGDYNGPKAVFEFCSNTSNTDILRRNTDCAHSKWKEHTPRVSEHSRSKERATRNQPTCESRSRSWSPEMEHRQNNKQSNTSKVRNKKMKTTQGKTPSKENLHYVCDTKRKRQSSSESDNFSDEDVPLKFGYKCTSQTSDYGSGSMFGFKSTGSLDKQYNNDPGSATQNTYLDEKGKRVSQSIIVKDVTNVVIDTGGGNKTGPSIVTNPKQWSDVHTLVKDRRQCALESIQKEFNKHGAAVETEGYYGAKENLMRPNKDKLAIFIGNGDGATFSSLKLFHELSTAQNESGSPEVESYVLNHPSEWCCVEKDRNAVILVQHAAGTCYFDKQRLEDWIRCIRQDILPASKGKITLIMTLKSFEDEDFSSVTSYYGEYVIDLSSKRYRISNNTKEDLLQYFMRKHSVWICKLKKDETIQQDKSKLRLMCEDTFKDIVRLSERRGFVKKVNDFFNGNLHHGSAYFCDPTTKLVDRIKKLPAHAFLTLIAVYAAGGHIDTERIDQMGRLNVTKKRVWFSTEEGLNKSRKNISTSRSSTHFHMRMSTAETMMYQYASKFNLLSFLHEALLKGITELENVSLLEKIEDTYSFSGDAVKNSFLIVASKTYPVEVLSTCDEDFLYKFVRIQTVNLQTDVYLTIRQGDHGSINAMMERAKEAFLSKHVQLITAHPIMRESWFFDRFLEFIKKTPTLTWTILKQREADSKDPYGILFYGMENSFKHRSVGAPNNITEKIIQHGKWKTKRQQRTEEIEIQENAALWHAAELAEGTTFEDLVKMGVPITFPILITAIKSRSVGIVNYIVLNEAFSAFPYKSRCEALKCALEIAAEPFKSRESLAIFEILASQVGVNFKRKDVQSLVHFAARKNNIAMLNILTRSEIKVDLDLVSTNSETVLTISASEGYAQFAKVALEAGADQRKNSRIRGLPIHITASNGRTEPMRVFIDNNPMIVVEKDANGRHPLHVAVYYGHEEAVKQLLRSTGVQVNALDKHGQIPLHLAAKCGHTRILELLIENGASICERDRNNESPLSLACKGRHYETVNSLLKHYSTKNLQHEFQAMICAVKASAPDFVGLFLKFGYHIDMVDEMHGSLMHVAIENGLHDMVDYLLRNNAHTEIQFRDFSPVHQASIRGDIKMLKLLLSHGAKIDAKQSHTGDTLVHLAASKVKEELIKEIFHLPESHFLVDLRNMKGETALHIACQGGNVQIVRVLLQMGFSRNFCTKRQDTPMTLAKHGLNEANKQRQHSKGDAFHQIIKLLIA